MSLLLTALLASACSNGPSMRSLRAQAARAHACPVDGVTIVNEFTPPRGLVVSVCGIDRYFVEEGGVFREVTDLPPRARVTRVIHEHGRLEPGEGGGSCGPGHVYVRSYTRRGGRVHGYCRRR